jgi:tRNA 2-thiocytidine biosynthesis protein TtcA
MAFGPETVDVEAARREIASGESQAVDVRSEEEWSKGHVPGAIHILNGGSATDRTTRLEDGARLIVIAANNKLAIRAAKDLCTRGYDAVAVDGGMDDWVSQGFPIQPTADPDEDTELGLK